jgi:hypothetical protein
MKTTPEPFPSAAMMAALAAVLIAHESGDIIALLRARADLLEIVVRESQE